MEHLNEKDKLRSEDIELRKRITMHCRWLHGFDPAYATAAYNHYRELLPWINLPAPKK